MNLYRHRHFRKSTAREELFSVSSFSITFSSMVTKNLHSEQSSNPLRCLEKILYTKVL